MESQTAAHSVKPQPCAGLGIIPLVLTSLMMPETGRQGELIQQWHLPSDSLLSLGSLSVPFSPNRSWSVHPYHPAPGWLGQAHIQLLLLTTQRGPAELHQKVAMTLSVALTKFTAASSVIKGLEKAGKPTSLQSS